jgi:hypothetical protein
MKLKILGHKIIFKFVQEVTDGKFKASTDWGFQIKTQNDDPKFARWGKVVDFGPEVADIEAGDYVLIEPLMWTTYMEIDDGKVWGTNRDKIIAVSKTEPTGLI